MWTVIDLTIGDRVDTTAPVGEASVQAGPLGSEDDAPVADGPVTVDLRATDEQGGSGLAFVRLSNEPEVDADGALASGTTWPATTSVAWSVEDGQVVVPPMPRATPTPKPTKRPKKTPRPTATPEAAIEPSPSPVIAGIRTISVQWRDVAGNWSEPIEVDVWYAPEGSVPAPEASPVASGPPRRLTAIAVRPAPSMDPARRRRPARRLRPRRSRTAPTQAPTRTPTPP